MVINSKSRTRNILVVSISLIVIVHYHILNNGSIYLDHIINNKLTDNDNIGKKMPLSTS